MKKYIYLILGFLCCSYLFYYILNLEKYNSKLKNDLQKELYIKYYLETIHKQSNKLLGKRINFSLVKDSSRFNLKEVCKFPCLIH